MCEVPHNAHGIASLLVAAELTDLKRNIQQDQGRWSGSKIETWIIEGPALARSAYWPCTCGTSNILHSACYAIPAYKMAIGALPRLRKCRQQLGYQLWMRGNNKRWKEKECVRALDGGFHFEIDHTEYTTSKRTAAADQSGRHCFMVGITVIPSVEAP